MCITCIDRQEFNEDKEAVNHMKANPFHMVLWYGSVDEALDRAITESEE